MAESGKSGKDLAAEEDAEIAAEKAAKKSVPELEVEVEGRRQEVKGCAITPWRMIGFHALVSLIIGLTGAYLVFLLDSLGGRPLMTHGVAWLLAVILGLWFFLIKDPKEVNVPNGYVAPMTFLGKRTQYYLTDGDYRWTGQRFFFRPFNGTVPSLVKMEGAVKENAEKGFVFTGDLVLPIWNNAKDKNKINLSLVTRNGDDVSVNVTLVVHIIDLWEWIQTDDPVLEIAERARRTIRETATMFTGFDCGTLHTIFEDMMMGGTIVSSYIRNDIGSDVKGSMIQDRNGRRLYVVAKKGQDVKRAITKFVSKKWPHVHPSMREHAAQDNKVLPVVDTQSLPSDLSAVLDKVGVALTNMSISHFAFSEVVAEQANKAASEPQQRNSLIATARAQKEARREMKEEPGEATDMVSKALVAMQDPASKNNVQVKVVVVPEADKLTRAAAVLGSTQGDKE